MPDKYQEVKYIKSTGTQFINTRVYPKSTTGVIFDFEITDGTGYNGWWSAGDEEAFRWFYSTLFSSSVSSQATVLYVDGEVDYNRHKFELYSGRQLFDGVKYGDTTIGNTATDKQYLYLFAIHQEWNNRICRIL